MGDVQYKHDFGGLRKLAVGAEMHVMLLEAAFAGKEYAISISPDAPPFGAGYIESFEVDGSHTERIAGLKRAVVYLRNTSEHAVFVECGNGTEGSASAAQVHAPQYRDGYHVLRRTSDWLERS